MSPRERLLALGILTAVIVVGGGFLFYNLFWTPLQDLDTQLVSVQQEIEDKEQRLRDIEAAKIRLQRLKQLSLPTNVEFSRREYEMYLHDLLGDSGFSAGFTVMPKQAEPSSPIMTGKGPAYTRLPYTVVGHATLANLVNMLERFYREGLLHQIKSLKVARPSGIGSQPQQSILDIHMIVEALIVAGADNRPMLRPALDRRLLVLDVVAALRHGPTGLGLVLWAGGPAGPAGPGVLARSPRQYAAIAKKNIFLGSTALDRPAELVAAPRFVHLTDITHTSDRPCEAFLYDRLSNQTTRLRAEAGFDTFWVVSDEGKTFVRGKVIRLDDKDLFFQDEENYYRMHVGDDLDMVLRRPLTGEELKVLRLSTVVKEISTGN